VVNHNIGGERWENMKASQIGILAKTTISSVSQNPDLQRYFFATDTYLHR
jgi:hypothetical protein